LKVTNFSIAAIMNNRRSAEDDDSLVGNDLENEFKRRKLSAESHVGEIICF
jgi:hypothetical protein